MNSIVGRIFWDFLREKYWTDQVVHKIQKKLSKIKVSVDADGNVFFRGPCVTVLILVVLLIFTLIFIFTPSSQHHQCHGK